MGGGEVGVEVGGFLNVFFEFVFIVAVVISMFFYVQSHLRGSLFENRNNQEKYAINNSNNKMVRTRPEEPNHLLDSRTTSKFLSRIDVKFTPGIGL